MGRAARRLSRALCFLGDAVRAEGWCGASPRADSCGYMEASDRKTHSNGCGDPRLVSVILPGVGGRDHGQGTIRFCVS